MKKILLPLLFVANTSFAQTIAVDVGHHNKDPGAISAYGHSEFSYNRRMAHSVIRKLQDYGNKVKPVGYNGNPITLKQRTKLATGSDFFVSIHHDSVKQNDLQYWEHEGYQNHFNDEVNGFGIFVSMKNPHVEQSLVCAKKISDNLIAAGFTPNFYHVKSKDLFFPNEPIYRYDNLVVLKTAKMPAVLVEAGVIVNRKEALWITQDDVRNEFSEAVAKAITKCMKK